MRENLLEKISRNRSWNANWIWNHDNGDIENSFYYFRKEFNLQQKPNKCKLYITADTRYKLYLNGEFVGEGPVQSQPYFKYYDMRDISDKLKAVRNCLAVIVNYTGVMPDTRGGLLVELVDDRGNILEKTDNNWKVKRASAWRQDTLKTHNYVATHQEVYDARKVPEGWENIGFNDRDWNKAQVLKTWGSNRPPAVSPWTNLIARDIPFMCNEYMLPTRIEKVEEALDIANRYRDEDLSIVLSATGKEINYSTVKNTNNLLTESETTIIQNSTNHLDHLFDGIYDPCILIDFGKVITGFVELDIDGIEGGIIDIGYAERLIDGEFNNAIECQFAERYIMKEGKQRFRSFTWKGFRYLKLRFRSCFEPVTINFVKSIVTNYPYQEKGSFEADDKEIQKIFDISQYTLKLCSQEFIMDTPWREQAQWLGDVSAVTLGGIYSCFGDTKLPSKFLRQSAANQHPTGLLDNITNIVSKNWNNNIPSYSLWWIKAIWEHYQYTGNETCIHKYYPHVLKIIQTFLRYLDNNVLISDMAYWPLIEWANLERRGEYAVLNALFYGALLDVKKMAEIKQDQYTIELVEEVRSGIKENFVARLYNRDKGCFVDANIDGKLSDKISEHANAAAILWGLCEKEISEKIISNFYEKKNIFYTEAQPYFTTVVLQALDSVNRFDLALEIIRERWGKRMVDRGASSTFEEWGINGSWRSGNFKGFLRTLSHAWSAHPAEFLIRNLIGLEIIESGCKKVKINPKWVEFNYSVVFPTPAGNVQVLKEDDSINVLSSGEINIMKEN